MLFDVSDEGLRQNYSRQVMEAASTRADLMRQQGPMFNEDAKNIVAASYTQPAPETVPTTLWVSCRSGDCSYSREILACEWALLANAKEREAEFSCVDRLEALDPANFTQQEKALAASLREDAEGTLRRRERETKAQLLADASYIKNRIPNARKMAEKWKQAVIDEDRKSTLPMMNVAFIAGDD